MNGRSTNVTRKGGPHPVYSGADATCPRCGEGPVTRGERRYGAEQFIGAGIRCAYMNLTGEGPDWMLRECLECGHHWAEELPNRVPSGQPVEARP